MENKKNRKSKLIKSTLVFFILLTFVIPQALNVNVFAESDIQFKVSQKITVEDLPGIPQNLSAGAVSSSQINLSWDASAPGSLPIAGYKIFRDNVFIDSTSNTFYSDIGLQPDTTYTYRISAFDTGNNESGLSDPASATTFPEEPSVPPPGGAGSIVFSILRFSVQPDLTEATIKIETNLPSHLIIRWGKTADYELGSLVSADSRQIHTTVIPNLAPDTLHFFEFEVVGRQGQRIIVRNQQFRTLSPFVLPLNVSDLTAVGDEEKITLTWRNPLIKFKSIRIVRSTRFFPRDPFDGELVFEGVATRFVDRNVQFDTNYYYAVFVEDFEGRFSSGAITSTRLLRPDEIPPPPDLFAGVLDLPSSEVHPLFLRLRLKDFDFIQDGEKAAFIDDETVLVKGDKVLTVSLDYKKVPEVLKTITVILHDADDPSKIFHFLLRVNEDRTVYEASISPLEREGSFGLRVAILDHKNMGLTRLAGVLKTILPVGFVLPVPKFPIWPLFWIFLVLIVGLVIWKLRPRERVTMAYGGES